VSGVSVVFFFGVGRDAPLFIFFPFPVLFILI